jgi:hypothetical protein
MSFFCNDWCTVFMFLYGACTVAFIIRKEKLFEDEHEGKLDKFEQQLKASVT